MAKRFASTATASVSFWDTKTGRPNARFEDRFGPQSVVYDSGLDLDRVMADVANLKMTRQYFEETTYSKKSLPDGALRAENFLTIERFF